MIVLSVLDDTVHYSTYPLLLAGMQQVFYLYFLSVLFVDRAHHLEVARGVYILSMRHHFNFLKFQI